jgi:serine/threonine protein phosphatase PrpC
MKLTVQYAGLSDAGQVCKTNQDSWLADPAQELFIVADGMGGEFAGALASKAVVATLPELVRTYFGTTEELPGGGARRRLSNALATLSRQLRQQTQNEPGLAGMGSTVVCALVRGGQVLIAHMGDSRAYRLRGGHLTQLTSDHTIIQMLLQTEEITLAEAARHPARGLLTRNMGMEGEPLPQTRLLKLRPNDQLLLCSDGLTGMLGDEQILTILKAPLTLEARCQRLIDAANRAGGKDNITAVLLSFAGDVEKKQLSATAEQN